MKILFKKDIEILKQNGLFYLIVIIMSMSLLGDTSMIGTGMIWSTVIGLNLIGNDKLDNSLSYLFTLPFSKKDYINHMYLILLLPTLLFSLLSLLIYHDSINLVFIMRSLGILLMEISVIAITNVVLVNRKNILNTFQVIGVIVFLMVLLATNSKLMSTYIDLKYNASSDALSTFISEEMTSSSIMLIVGAIVLVVAYLVSSLLAKKMEA